MPHEDPRGDPSTEGPLLPWFGYINQLTYGIDLRSRVGNPILTHLADSIVQQHGFRDPVADYYYAALAALRPGQDFALVAHDDEEVLRDLLMRLVQALDERRPWSAAFASPETAQLSEAARIVIGTLIYSVKFEPLDETLVDRRARALIDEPLGELSAADEYRALEEALCSRARLSDIIQGGELPAEQDGEHRFRDFLRRILTRMDALRPWQEPLHRSLRPDRWADYRDARVVARIDTLGTNTAGRLRSVFSRVEDEGRDVLILRLRSGDEIALVTPWWPASDDSAVLSRDSLRSPEDIVAALVDGTGFTSDDITPIHDG